MAGKQEMQESVALAGIFANRMRLSILDHLVKGPCLVGDLAKAVGYGQAVVSKQLGTLRAAGLLECRTDGRYREYVLADATATGAALKAMRFAGARAAENAERCRQHQMEGHNA